MNPSNIKERDDWYILSHNQQWCCPLLSKRNHLRQVTQTSGWGHCKPKRCLQLTVPPKTPLPGSIQRFLWEPDLSASRPPGSAGFMNHEAHFDGCFEMVHVCAICLTDQHGRATNDQKKVWTGFNKVTSYNYCHFAPLHGHRQARSRWKCPSETKPTPWHHTAFKVLHKTSSLYHYMVNLLYTLKDWRDKRCLPRPNPNTSLSLRRHVLAGHRTARLPASKQGPKSPFTSAPRIWH